MALRLGFVSRSDQGRLTPVASRCISRTAVEIGDAHGAAEPPCCSARVRVRHPNGLELTVTGDFPIKYFALYADARAVSPEPFIAIDLRPGKTTRWTRSYRFASRPRPAE